MSTRSIPDLTPQPWRKLALAKRVTGIGMGGGGALSASKSVVGWIAHPKAAFTDGLENAGELFVSALGYWGINVHSA